MKTSSNPTISPGRTSFTCSLRSAGVGCPEHAQVGPLPRLSKSRRSGHLVGLADSGVPMNRCWASRAHRQPVGSNTMLRGRPTCRGPRDLVAGAPSPAAHWELPQMLRARFLPGNHLDVALLELLGIDRARRAEHQVLMALSLGECDDITDVFGVFDRHHQAVDAG